MSKHNLIFKFLHRFAIPSGSLEYLYSLVIFNFYSFSGTFVVVWKKGASLLSAGQQKITRDTRVSLHGYNLEIRDIKSSDQGDYTCQLGDGADGDLIHTIEILSK